MKFLKDKEKETEALRRTINEKDEQLQLMKSAFIEKQMETEALLQRVYQMEAQLQQSRSALIKKEDEHEKLNQSFQAFHQQQNHNARFLKDKEKETEALKRIINEKDEQLQLMKSASKEKQMETEALLQRSALIKKEDEHEKLNQRSTCKEKQKETETLLQRVKEMEAQLQQSRSALQEKDEQLKSFKDRVAGEVAVSIKTGKTMSLKYPVNKNRLKEMYEDLRCDWPKIKKNLKSNKKHPDSVKELILKEFQDAKIDMRNRRKMIDKVFEKGKNDGGMPQKVDQYRQLTVQNLQMTLYSQKQDAGSQKPFLENEAANPQDVLKYLGSECYWLGCLMALNNPPLQPDWENHPPSMDRWDVFPRNIRTASDYE
ncbi:probable DNA double-strand break repair Rad50 ATPase [Poeciliopsis prolifica]|uniref:probable DNA double-strand break repair Rad50 ATPase n=1 Tax=Poeciliopsis prolifica TaxID=188132 RepID=UPI002413781B|nr:probable DNA double-strand break repair Rad50 ATPase [Poeciliopsis prolifica]